MSKANLKIIRDCHNIMMDILIVPFLRVLLFITDFYRFFLYIYIIMSWLDYFNIVNKHNAIVYNVYSFLYKITEPALRRIRRIVPSIGYIDLTPIVLVAILYFVEQMIGRILIRFPL
jgi:YggT family protein